MPPDKKYLQFYKIHVIILCELVIYKITCIGEFVNCKMEYDEKTDLLKNKLNKGEWSNELL